MVTCPFSDTAAFMLITLPLIPAFKVGFPTIKQALFPRVLDLLRRGSTGQMPRSQRMLCENRYRLSDASCRDTRSLWSYLTDIGISSCWPALTRRGYSHTAAMHY